jgi:IS1 family transposase
MVQTLWQKLAGLAVDYQNRTMREAAERGVAQEERIRELESQNSELRARLATFNRASRRKRPPRGSPECLGPSKH